MKKTALFGSLLMATTLFTGVAQADSLANADRWAKERFMLRGRVIGVVPQEDSSTNIGGHVTADAAIVPELDLTYFFTDHISAELIAAITPHDMGAKNTSLGNLSLGDVWLLPPTLTAQYHFNPHGEIRPYAGAGLGYIMYFDETPGAVTNIKYDDGIAYVLQAGVDIPVDEHWAVNLDVKKLFHNVDVTINGGAVTADVDLDPWIIGAGVGYRF
ncbi:MAG: OmpW family outer membrane protein [Rickettsiales bacterium]|nr:OmpW family outer membrane protein [Rickettsiales bacterium]